MTGARPSQTLCAIIKSDDARSELVSNVCMSVAEQTWGSALLGADSVCSDDSPAGRAAADDSTGNAGKPPEKTWAGAPPPMKGLPKPPPEL